MAKDSISFRLPLEEKEKLERICGELDIPISQLMRQLIREFLKNQE